MTAPPRTALLVEDEPQIRRVVRAALESEGWRVLEAATGREGRSNAATRAVDLVVVDLGLPDGDGVDLVRDLRAGSAVPVIVLSARRDEGDKVSALDAGADDYVEKPFAVAELLARVRAQMRRRDAAGGGQSRVALGDVEVDLAARVVVRRGAEVHLTPIEYRLLATLVANAGRVLTHRHLLREVWGPAYVEHPQYLRVFMGRLRHKLEDDPAQPRWLLTETGIGYRLVAPASG